MLSSKFKSFLGKLPLQKCSYLSAKQTCRLKCCLLVECVSSICWKMYDKDGRPNDRKLRRQLTVWYILIHTSYYDYSEAKATLFYKGLQNTFGNFVQTHFCLDLCILSMQCAVLQKILQWYFLEQFVCNPMSKIKSTLYVYILVY